ncbi:MAG: hypothetical protein FRX49_05056 [Trebouxia sp. A1-2]|nr:MAG: hypothetical protein FRX49_05056 [Trebouxia sp. A1-2]
MVPFATALAAAKQRIKKLERQVLRLSKTISHQGKKPKALWEEVRLQDKWVCREATTAEKAVGHASRSSATARVDHEDPASTSGSSEAAPSFIQSALHINATAGSLAQSARLPQTSGRARQLTYHVDSYQASALGRSSWEESGSSTRSHGWSAASCSTSLPGRQAAVRSRLDAPAISRFTDASGSQAAVRSRPGASAISRFTDASGSQAAVRSRPDASASSSFTAESSSAAGTASITSRVSSRISILGKALVGTVTGLRIPDARTRGSQGQRGGTWQASNVPELLLSTLGRTPVVGALAAVPIAAARFGVKALVTAAAGSRFSQTAQTEESALSVQACQEIIMARLSADKSSCLALVVQSPLAAAHGKADAARVAIMAGKFHDAVILCKEGLNMKPEDAYVRACLYHNRGLAYSCLGQPILTIGDCSMAHRLSPLLWQPVYHRYLAYDAIGATRDALKDLKMVKQLGHPISWEDMFYLRWSHRYKPHQIQSEQVLGVAGIARDERKGAARAAFKKLSLMYHPDKAATDQKEIAKQLYEYIRAAIDELGAAPASKPTCVGSGVKGAGLTDEAEKTGDAGA